MICPGCNGAKTFTGFVCRHKADGGYGSVETYNCHTCDGRGEITQEHHERIMVGRQMRDERIARDESLMEAAKRMGIKTSELSAIEHGKISAADSRGESDG